ncbi:efflux RND transporter periplasmic adaptor subunit [Brevibacillus sp. SYSU BS000544]|uniref:efflux RND transporter periplasmic adaptor subunit n=1 Tax=Brevibacillus sp. SYSU BS000544 TaxID=3416443 RepID=UPI003CE45F62
MKKMIAVLMTTLLILSGCEKLEADIEKLKEREKESVIKAKTVEVYKVEPNAQPLVQQIYGTATPSKELSLSFGTSGKIAKIHVQKGSFVKAGTVLATLDTSVWEQQIAAAQGAVEQANARRNQTLQGATSQEIAQQKLAIEKAKQSLKKATNDYEQGKRLFDNGAISKDELDRLSFEYKQALLDVQDEQVELEKLTRSTDKADIEEADANVKQAAADLLRAKQDMKDAQLIAPFSGVVTTVSFQDAEQVGGGQEVIKLIDASKWLVKLQVESEQNDIWRKGMKVKLSTSNGKQVDGEVTYVSAALDEKTGTYPVEVSVQGEVPDWKAGMTIVCQYEIQKPQALLVPITSVGISAESHYVMKVDGTTVRKTPVTVGGLFGEYYEIVDGLTMNEEVIKAGISYVIDGESVQVLAE